jgi:hypothetical protein
MRNAIRFLAVVLCLGCQYEVDDVAGIPTTPVTWPLTGGLDTSKSPLLQQPGSALQLDDVTQERLGEWRNRYGFTQSALDALPNGIAPMMGKLGAAGMFALNDYFAIYRPSLGSSRWSTAGAIQVADDITRIPIAITDNPVIGFAQSGNMYLIANLDSVAPAVILFDAQGRTSTRVALTAGLYLRARCAATAGKLVAYLASTAGNVDTIVFDATTGASVGPTTIKAGAHATAPYLDALWDGSSATITVVVRLAAGDAVRFMEHNPSTGALATDVSLAAIVANSALSLFQDYSNSGVRFVGTSDSTGPTTRVLRVTSAGAITQNDLQAAVTSLVITGVGYNAGTYYSSIYQTNDVNRTIYASRRDGGGLAVPAALAFMSGASDGVTQTIDGQAWSHDGVRLQFLMGTHSTVASDPQDTWTMQSQLLAGGNIYPQSRIAPLQAQAIMINSASTQSALFQRPTVSAHSSAFALPVLASYALSGGVQTRRYSIDVFVQQILGSADIATTVNKGPSIQYKQTAFVPANSLSYVDGDVLLPIGQSFLPGAVFSIAQSGGGSLTLLATYSYLWLVEHLDSDGNVWRSPPSVPVSVTMTGANNRNTVSFSVKIESILSDRYRVKLYRTSANGSVYRLINSSAVGSGAFAIVDSAADSAIAASEILYTTGEVPTAITPRASHIMTAKDRLWLVNADFRTELWYSKNLRPGRQPEFTNIHSIDIDDNYGDITGLSTIDDNLVVFKRNAIYFVTGDGFDDGGGGTNVTAVLATGDIGAIPGSPIVQAGDAIYFISDRGIYAIGANGSIDFVGRDVDKYLNQPQVQTQERVWDGAWLPSKNEVRFVTDNYILVYSKKFSQAATLVAGATGAYWCRWRFAGGRRALVINNQMVVIKSDSTVWREGDQNQLTDQGTAINGVIRGAWICPAGVGGWLRLRKLRAIGTRTSGGGAVQPSITVYFNYDDTQTETYTAPAAVPAGTTPVVAQGEPRARRCTSFSPQFNFPPGDNTFRLDQWEASVGIKQGGPKTVGVADRWR